MIFQNHSSLWVCITVRLPSPLLQRERMEPSWRLSKYTHKPLRISFLIHDLNGFINPGNIWCWCHKSPGSLVYWRPVLEASPSKTLSPKNDLKATMGTDCMFNQSDLWEEGSSLLVWLRAYMQWESCPVGFPHALYGILHMSGFQRLKGNTLTHDNRPIRYNHPRMAKGQETKSFIFNGSTLKRWQSACTLGFQSRYNCFSKGFMSGKLQKYLAKQVLFLNPGLFQEKCKLPLSDSFVLDLSKHL